MRHQKVDIIYSPKGAKNSRLYVIPIHLPLCKPKVPKLFAENKNYVRIKLAARALVDENN